MRQARAPRCGWRAPGRPGAAWRSCAAPRPWPVCPLWPAPRRRAGHARRSSHRLVDQPFDQFAVADADELRLFGDETERGHAGLSVDLEQIEAGLALLVVPAKVGARRALAAEQTVGARGH